MVLKDFSQCENTTVLTIEYKSKGCQDERKESRYEGIAISQMKDDSGSE